MRNNKKKHENITCHYDNIGVVADNCEMSYRFFGELGKIIYQKLLSVVTLLEKQNVCLNIETGSWLIHDIIADVFSLPLVNVPEGVDLGIKIFRSLEEGGISAFNDNHFQVLMPSDGERNLHDELFAKFQQLGIFFIFQSLYVLVLKFPCWFLFISPVSLLRCFISSLQLFTFSFISSVFITTC